MKKIIIFTMLIVANTTFAQKSEKFIQDIKIGGILANVASTDFSKSEKPFSFGQNLFGVVTLKTKKTFHNVLYGFANNSLSSLNGYFLPHNWDAYVVYSHALRGNSQYLGAGIEKMEKISSNVKLFVFGEVGTNLLGNKSFTFGVLLNSSWSLKRK